MKIVAKLIVLPILATLTFFTGCITDTEPEPKPASTKELFVFETDYSSGNIGSLDSNYIYTSRLTFSDDASIYSYNGAIYILEQYGVDNIVKLNATGTGVEYQKHLIDNVNPHDIGFISTTKAYVVCNKYNKILVVNISDGSISDSIDISSWAFVTDSTTNTPNAESIIIKDGFAYVSLQRRNGYKNGGATVILKINISTDEIVKSDTCTYPNGGKMVLVGDDIYIPNKGSFQSATDGGIEKYNITAGTISVVAAETAYNWSITAIYPTTGTLAVAQCVNYDASWVKTAITGVIDLSTGVITDTITEVTEIGPAIYDSEKDRLFIGERDATAGAGVCIWENGKYLKKVTTDIAPNGFVFLTE